MTIAVKCGQCGKTLRAPEHLAGRSARCPHCAASVPVPAGDAPPDAEEAVLQDADHPEGADSSAWQPALVVSLAEKRPRWGRWLILMLVILLFVGGFVLIPPFLPQDPREVVLREFLNAAKNKDAAGAERFGVMDIAELHPDFLGKVGDLQPAETDTKTVRDSFAPIANFHRQTAGKYRAQGEVFMANDLTGVLAKAINLKQEIDANPPSLVRDPKRHRDELDATVEFAENYLKNLTRVTDLVTGGPQKGAVVVTYKQLLEQHRDKFSPEQWELLQKFNQDSDKWKKALGRDYRTLAESREFSLEEATWEAAVWPAHPSTGSFGSFWEKPKKVKFRMLRFQVGLIDTGWKVWEITDIQ